MKPVQSITVAIAFSMLGCLQGANAHITIRIFASDAVAQPLRQIGYMFEKAHPNVKLDYEFAASGVFMRAIEQGVPPDIFISSSHREMNKLISLSFINFPQTIAYDYFSAASPCSNPVGNSRRPHITSRNLLQELRSPGISVGLASPTLSPAGRDIRDILKKMSHAGGKAFVPAVLSHTSESVGPNFTMQQIVAGRMDVGIVYASQVIGAKRSGTCVNMIPLRNGDNKKVKLTVAVLRASQLHFVGPVRKRLDADYAHTLTSAKAQHIFQEWGLVPAHHNGTIFSKIF